MTRFEAYAASKARLFEMQITGAAVVPSGDECAQKIGKELSDCRSNFDGPWPYPPVINNSIELTIKIPRSGRVLEVWSDFEEVHKNWPTVQGPHNMQNAAAAIETCRLLGLTYSQIDTALRTYLGLPHRMERIRERDGVLYVNDSKATNPTSTAPALAAYPVIHWILGGQAKTDELDACVPHLSHVKTAFTIGHDGAMLADVLRPHGVPVSMCGTLDQAVWRASRAARPGETVLLSPACASFDQFRDYEDRGDQFRKLVEAL